MRTERAEKGSISIEATISLVVFTFFFICVLQFINISRAQMHLQIAVDKAAQEISGYLYLYQLTGLYDLDMSVANSGDKAINAYETAKGSLDNIAKGIEDLTDQIGNTKDMSDSDALLQQVKSLVDTGVSTGKTLDAESSTLKTLYDEIADNPMVFVKSLAAVAGTAAMNKAKSVLLGELLAKSLTVKYLGGKSEADSLLKRFHVEDGTEGLDFSLSTFFARDSGSASAAEDINLIVLYRMSVAPLLGKTFSQTFAITASARCWLGGDTQIDRLKSPNPAKPG